MANSLTNGRPGFIGYADSCLTGAVDSEDSFAEALLKNPDGGAVGYVGSTRFSWIGLGDDVQRAFFKRLKQTRHLGLLNDCRMGVLDFNYWHAYARWVAMSLTLFGDPEMSVWRSTPRVIGPSVSWKKPDLRIPIEIELPRPPRPDEIGRRLPARYLISVSQDSGFSRLAYGEAGEKVSVDVSDAKAESLTLTITADSPDYAPFERTFDVDGPLWITGRVARIRCEDNVPWTGVEVRTSDGNLRNWVVGGNREDGDAGCKALIHALMRSQETGADIALQVERIGDGGRIEGFRLPA
jgi:hypothetical protein